MPIDENKKVPERIINHLENNQERLISREEIVTAVYGNATNLFHKKRSIDVYLSKHIKKDFRKKGFELITVRRKGLKLHKII